MAYVYLLRCRDGSLYCGWTVDIDRRVATHAAGKGGRYTARRLPVALARAWECEDRIQAMRLEWRIKQLSREEKVALVDGAPLPSLPERN